MKSGLYAHAGDSATARAAAWAKRFDGPATKVSKVKRACRRDGALPGRGRDLLRGSAAVRGFATRSRRPARRQAPRRGRGRPPRRRRLAGRRGNAAGSIPRANSVSTARTRCSSVSSSGRLRAKARLYMAALTVGRRRSRTSSQTSSGVGPVQASSGDTSGHVCLRWQVFQKSPVTVYDRRPSGAAARWDAARRGHGARVRPGRARPPRGCVPTRRPVRVRPPRRARVSAPEAHGCRRGRCPEPGVSSGSGAAGTVSVAARPPSMFGSSDESSARCSR